jgi:hypothetical protein
MSKGKRMSRRIICKVEIDSSLLVGQEALLLPPVPMTIFVSIKGFSVFSGDASANLTTPFNSRAHLFRQSVHLLLLYSIANRISQ